ncbi:MAG: dTDP-glucose 4,6-dehydratase [Candidatus Omnitrophota bacterium]|nr:dTDP-glucose 4,6-dehydratase [Candidatus Omnitrophota bacterium]
MRLLITGGCGFIGSNFIRYILKRYPNYKIVNLDKLTYAGNLDNLKDVKENKNYKFIKGDICNYKTVDSLVKGIEVIINFAAETHVDRSIVDASNFIKTNYNGTYILLEAALKNKIKYFLQISTDEVYGSRVKGFFKESDTLNPSSPYSASKAAADLLAVSYFKTYKLPVFIARSSNNFGPCQYPEKVIPLFITNILQNKKLPLYSRGENIRDWLFVLDNCLAIDLILHKGLPGEIYNISAGNYLKNSELTKIILKKMDKPWEFINFVKDRPGHDFRYAMDSLKIAKLGWKPRYKFLNALDLTINWYRENSLWWKKLKAKF